MIDSVPPSTAALEMVLTTRPDDLETLVNLAGQHLREGRFSAALPLCRRAAQICPDEGPLFYNLGLVQQNLGQFEAALESFEQAATLAPDNAEIRKSLGLALLRFEHWTRGWMEFEQRFGTAEYRDHQPPLAVRWDGKPSKHATLLLYTEQGMGDALHFIRFAPLARQRVGRLVIGCPPELAPLLAQAEGVDKVISWGESLPPVGLQYPLLSLPRLFDLSGDALARTAPYLAAPGEARARWEDRLPNVPTPRIGLVWRGNEAHGNDRYRSIDWPTLAPLTERTDLEWMSLQKDAHRCPANIQDLAPQLSNFAETAAAVERLDLVITVDTAVAHLAGALGRPTWILLPRNSDWRWGVDREASIWYPSVRLFRQRDGGWGPVVAQVKAALAQEFPASGLSRPVP
ncbi:tetratricopeptide repeat protein [Magnetospira thiophila]